MSESSGDVVARYFTMWNTGDVSVADEILSPGWVDHAHPEVAGPDGVRQAVTRIRAARPDLRFEVDAVLGDGDLAAAVGSAGGAGRIVWLVRLDGARMAEMWTFRESVAS